MNMKRRNSRSKSSASSKSGAKKSLLRRFLRAESLERRDLMAIDGFNPFHNYDLPVDSNGDANVSAMDALVIINALNSQGAKSLSGDNPSDWGSRLPDVNRDGYLSPMDALGIINYLNGEGQGELAQFTFQTTDMLGNPLSSNNLPVNTRFRLISSVQDLRPDPLGVYSAALNVVYANPSHVRLVVGETQLLNFASDTNGGTFRLTYNGQTTGNIQFSTTGSLTAQRIQDALNALSSINGNVKVRQVTIAGNTRNYQITFKGSLALQDIVPLTGNFTSLTTTSGNSAGGTITDNFYPADPTNQGAFFNAIEFLPALNPLFPNSQTGTLEGDPGVYLGIGGIKSGTSFPDEDPASVDPIFALPFETVSEGQVTFAGTYADKFLTPVGLYDIDNPLEANQIDFSVLTINVVLNLKARDDGPVTVAEDSNFTSINVLANDESFIASPFDIFSTTSPANGQVQISADKKSVSYKPNANFFGQDVFTYTIKNQQGDTSTANVTVSVTSVNDKPIANNDTVTAVEDVVRTILSTELLANDVAGPANETQTLNINSVQAISTTGGTVALNGGNVIYTPSKDFNGDFRFSYTINDGGSVNNISDPATVTIKVSEVNDAPETTNDTVTNTNEDETRTIAISTLLGNDRPGPVTALDEVPPNQTIQLKSVNAASQFGGTVTINGTNVLYKSALNFNGLDTFVYEIEDNGKTNGVNDFKTAFGTVSLQVAPINDPPVAVEDNLAVDELSVNNVLDVLANDSAGPSNENQTLVITSVTAAAHGTVTVAADGKSLIYTPTADYAGPDSFTYTIRDSGNLTAQAVVNIDVVPVVRPRARNDRYTVSEDNPGFTADVLANDLANLGQKVKLLSFTQPTNGTVTLDDRGTPADQTDDRLLYKPNANFNSPAGGVDIFTYTINDTSTVNPGADSTATVSITVTEENDPPTANDDQLAGREDTVRTILASEMLANDSAGPSNESSQKLVINSVEKIDDGGDVVINSAGNVVYTPKLDFNGIFRFRYTIRDDGTTAGAPNAKISAPATVSITVAAVNDKPITTNDVVNGAVEDVAKTIAISTLLGNDRPGPVTAIDEVPPTQNITLQSVQSSTGATVIISGANLIYTPAPFFNGQDTFTYVIIDDGKTDGVNDFLTATGTVIVNVSEVNNSPVAVNDSAIAYKNFPIEYEASRFLANDSPGPANESNQKLKIVSIDTTGTKGTVTLNTDGSIRYLPPTDYIGGDSFKYTIEDDGTTAGAPDPKRATATITLDVKDFIPSTISGVVYGEETGNSTIDENERFLGGVPIVLVGVALGEPVNRSTMTLANGTYEFDNLAPGSYVVKFTRPELMVDGADIVGTHGDADNIENQFTLNIAPPGNVQAKNYNFALNGLDLKYAIQLDSLASSYYARDVSLKTNGMIGVIKPGNNLGWTAAMDGYSNIAYSEMLLSNDGTRVILSVVNKNEEIYTTVLSRGQYVKTVDTAGNTLVRVLGGYGKFTWTKVALNAAPPVAAQKYLDSVEQIFAQEDWDGLPGG
jgi:hypothetical protein